MQRSATITSTFASAGCDDDRLPLHSGESILVPSFS